MNARSIVSIIIGFSLLLVLCTWAEEGRHSECELLIQEALRGYNEGKTLDGMVAIQHGSPGARKCRFLQEKIPSKCLEETGLCTDMASSKRSSAAQPISEQPLTLEKSGSISKPGEHAREVKRSAQRKRALEYECNYTAVDCQHRLFAKYRTLDGTCNNLIPGQSEWGSADRILSRFLMAAYNDGVGTPRTNSSYGLLPSPRNISNIIHEAEEQIEEDPTRSLFIMQMGQFLCHDFGLTELSTRQDGTPLECCGADITNEECFKIDIPLNEKYFIPGGCMNFARSRARPNCVTGVREQVNAHTSYLDLSMVYGVSEEESKALRKFEGGRMKSVSDKLPRDNTDTLCELSMPADDTNYYCPISGDVRVNEVPGLTSLHTLWLREHNRLANGLALKYRCWNDETLFQEARKIAIAEWQHIVYNEYLPATIGMTALTDNNMDVTMTGHKDTYSPMVDATIANAFSHAIFRFGHSLVQNKIALAQVNDEVLIAEDSLENNFFEPLLYHSNANKGTDNILKWQTTEHCPLSDRKIQPSVQRFLFLDNDNNSLDLASLNIQRGRDHGLASYNDYRQYVCNLPRASHFGVGPGGLVDHTEEVANLLQTAYTHPDQIDLFPGFVSEKRLPGSQHGPTGQCMMIKQFKRLRDGDRFFYERGINLPKIAFTLDQLNEIKKVRMSTLFCLNTADKPGKRVPGNMFFVEGTDNEYVNCEGVEGIDMNKF